MDSCWPHGFSSQACRQMMELASSQVPLAFSVHGVMHSQQPTDKWLIPHL